MVKELRAAIAGASAPPMPDDADLTKKLVGAWKQPKDPKAGTTTFSTDGTLTMNTGAFSIPGTYSVVKGKLLLKMTFDGRTTESPPVDIVKLTESELHISGGGSKEVTILQRFALSSDAKKLVGVWRAVNGGGSDFTYTFGDDGSATMQANLSDGKVAAFHGTFSVEKSTLHIEMDSKFTYDIVKVTDAELELRKAGEKQSEKYKRLALSGDAKKLVGLWTAVIEEIGFEYEFTDAGTFALRANRVETLAGTFAVEKGALKLTVKGRELNNVWSPAEIVKVTGTELELGRPGKKETVTFKRFVPADNPEYTSWSKFPKGTRVSFRETSTPAERPVTLLTTSIKTILDITPTEVVIEYEMVGKQTGLGLKDAEVGRIKPRKESIPKAAPTGFKVVDHTKKPEGATKEGGFETLKVGGTEFKAKWYEFELPVAKGQPAEVSKRWYSQEVPGVLMRFEHRIDGKLTQVWEVTEVKKP